MASVAQSAESQKVASERSVDVTSGNTESNLLPDAPLPVAATPSSAGEDSGLGAAACDLRRLPKQLVMDELHIVTSPARIHKGDLKWLLPLAGATGVALGTDTYTMRNVVSKNPAFLNASATSSDVLRGTAIGVPVVLFVAGAAVKNEHARESGFLAGEAMVDAYVVDEAIKYATLRERPYQDNARGHFFAGDAAGDPSFVSGHSIVAWSSAAVLAEEYSRPWQQVGIYTLASGVSVARVLAQQHFPTDALLGSAAGWLIGHYVFRARHQSKVVVNEHRLRAPN